MRKEKMFLYLDDVRTPKEFNSGYIQGALNLDYNGADFSRQLAALDKNKPVFISLSS